MIKNRDIVVIGIQPWNIEIGSNCKNIASEMSKNNRVLYINPPLGRISYLKESKHAINKDRVAVLKGTKNPLTKISNSNQEFYTAVTEDNYYLIKLFRETKNIEKYENLNDFTDSILENLYLN